MARCTISVIDATSAPDPAADWVIFRWNTPVVADDRLTKLAAGAGTADLVALLPGHHIRRVVDLDREPDAPLFDDAILMFRGPALRAHGLRPESDLSPDLAALMLTARYLLALPHRVVLIAPLHGPAPVSVDRGDAARYSVAPQRFAEVFEQARDQRGSIPRWLQNLWLRQLFAYLREDARLSSPSLPTTAVEAFHTALGRTLTHIDEEAIATYACADATDEARAALLIGVGHRHAHTRPVRRHDPGRGMSRVSYFFAAARPDERVTVDGVPFQPAHHKVRTVQAFGRPMLAERIVWIPEACVLDVDQTDEFVLGRAPAMTRLARYRKALTENPGVVRTVAHDLRLRRRGRSAAARRRYRAAWLLMDRDIAAQDNAEHLYRYLAPQSSINAWFVLARDSPDWPRLEREGFRLISYGSDEHFVALLNCAHLSSSQADDYVCRPFRKHVLGRPPWRFTFLQHGVIKDDISRWLNSKDIALFVTSTPGEHESIVGDRTPYVFTSKEVKMTGLPRFDRLRELGAKVPAAEREYLLVCPTWRDWLNETKEPGSHRRTVRDDFLQTEYVRQWRAFLCDESLRALAEDEGLRIGFLPHPNIQPALHLIDLPAHVEPLEFTGRDVQQLIADTALMVTDYSSMVFNAAYLDRPAVYFQFDADRVLGGGHIGRRGYYDYVRDGFGPVCASAEQAVAAVRRAVSGGRRSPAPEYAERIDRAFPVRDGRCCERTIAAVEELTTPGPRK